MHTPSSKVLPTFVSEQIRESQLNLLDAQEQTSLVLEEAQTYYVTRENEPHLFHGRSFH